AMPANAWLFACLTAISEDLAGLPIRVKDGGENPVPSHPFLTLLRSPGASRTERLLRQQLTVDLVLTGNAYILQLFGSRGQVVGLYRLHPARMEAIPSEDGSILAWEYNTDGGSGGGYRRYATSAIVHIRTPSHEDDERGLYGQGVVRSLDADIQADRALAEQSRRSAEKGRPDAVYHPSNPDQSWSPKQIKSMQVQTQRLMNATHGGVAVMTGAGKLEMLGWSPKDMEGVAQRTWTRETILAACGVPPSRVGLPTANYATQREQMITYWQGLIAKAAMIDDGLTAIAQRMDPGAGVMVCHDFSRVPALQASRGEALDRVKKHIDNGMDPLAAYRYEGFTDIDDTAFNGTVDPTEAVTEAIRALRSDVFAVRAAINSQTESTITRARYDDINFTPPKGVRDECQRGLGWLKDGHGGDGLVDATKRWARKLAKGDDITPDKARKMRAWLARHEADKEGEGFKPGEDGFPSPGRVAWALWGGDPAKPWSAKLVRQMDAADEDADKAAPDPLANLIQFPSETVTQ
ncbi:MAG: phage portal protein, partial [Myxococcota bacterium]